MKEDRGENSEYISNTKNMSEKMVLIIVIVIILGLMIIAFFNNNKFNELEENNDFNEEYYNGISYEEYQNLSYKEKENLQKTKFDGEKSNLKITPKGLDINGNLMILLENNNDNSVYDFFVYTIFYDGENRPISISSQSIRFVDESSKYYFTVDKTPVNFEKYDFLITKEYYSDTNYNSCKTDISFETYKNEEGNIIIKGKNNSSSKIDCVIFSIIYYDSSNKIIDIENFSEYELRKNKEFEIHDYYLYRENTYEKVEYDKYEVILNCAYSY